MVTVADSTAPELLFVGRLLEHKNANLAIEATNILSARGYDVHLGVIGVGPEEVRLKELVAELGLVDRVTFYSTIDSQGALWSLIRGTSVLLAPSVREGLGLVVAESLALGTPVVCALHSENESSRLVSQNTGSVVEAFSSLALADAAEYWLNDASDRSQRAGIFLAEHDELSEGAMSTSYAEILRSVA
jgi:glycosyltransferase involved in cell wall biosynthesis